MFQNTNPYLSIQNWRKGLVQRQKATINKNTTKGILIGAIVGSLAMIPIQHVSNKLSPLFTVKEVHKFHIVGAGAIIGSAIGAYKGSVIGRLKAEDIEYQELMEQTEKEHPQ